VAKNHFRKILEKSNYYKSENGSTMEDKSLTM
jgi:hypothetical protein